jgi:hypothetical protein
MTEQELEQRMKEIVDQYSPILDAKPIEQLKKEVKEGPKVIPNKMPETTYVESSDVQDDQKEHQGNDDQPVKKITH